MRNPTKPSRRAPPFRRTTLAGALALALLEGAAQAAPLDPLGPPVQLNVGPPGAVQSFDVELNNPGAGVALWQELRSDGRYAVYFRRFDRYGQLAPRQTHAVTDTLFRTQVLKVFDNGEFAVASWQGTRVKILIRGKDGAVLRSLPDIQCNTAPYSGGCKIAIDDEGDAVVVDLSDPILPYSVSYRHVVAQLHDAAGKVVKPWFVVDQPFDGVLSVGGPEVAVDADGDFVVAWNPGFQYEDPHFPYENNFAFVRLYHGTGEPKGDQFPDRTIVNGWTELAMDADGDFVVSGLGSSYSGWVQGWTVYRKDGTPAAQFGPFGLDDAWRYSGARHQVVMDDDGDYTRLITVNSQFAYYNYSVFSLYRRFSLADLGDRALVDLSSSQGNYDYDRFVDGDVAMDGKGHLAALWWQTFGNPGDPLGLFLQRFVGPPGESCAGAGATIVGTPGPDNLSGTNRDDVIHGKGDDDVIHGRGGNDAICGGKGNDLLYGDFGNDRLYGELGFDELYGGDGNDYLNGGLDVDFADGGVGRDFCKAESAGNCP